MDDDYKDKKATKKATIDETLFATEPQFLLGDKSPPKPIPIATGTAK